MQIQGTVLLLSVFLVAIVHAKPSPALMKELIALEKYLEKKQGSDIADGQNKNQDDQTTGGNVFESLLNEEMEPTDNGQDKPLNENNNNVGGDASNDGQKPDEAVRPEKPYKGATPEKPQEGVKPENTEEVLAPSGGEEDGEKPQEDKGPSKSVEQEETGREHIFAELNRAIEKFKAALYMLQDLGDEFRKQLENDDHKFQELEETDKQTKEKTKETVGKLATLVEEIEDAAGVERNSADKKSVKENAPARRSHLSNSELLNIVNSLSDNN